MAQVHNDGLLSIAAKHHLLNLLKNLKVYNFSLEISPGSIKGDNFFGIIAKVRVTGNNENNIEVILNLIVKSAPAHKTLRESFPLRYAYEREIYLYTNVIPSFCHIQEEKRIANKFAPFAKFYSATMENLCESLILEDMKELGFRLWNRFEPLEYTHALLVMKNYGKLHALSFAIRDQKPDLFQELVENTKEKILVATNNKKEMIELMQYRVETALSALDPKEDKKAYKKLKQFQADMMGKVHASVDPEAAGQYAVICHGDCWINNILFKYENFEDPTSPSELCFIDWQLSRICSPAIDLAYFIFTSTDKELRDQHYTTLINEYYNSLCSFLRELGSDPQKLFPYEILHEHLKKFSVYGLFSAIIVLHIMSSESEEIPDMGTVLDKNSTQNIFSYVPKNIDIYKNRIRGVVLDYIKYDYNF